MFFCVASFAILLIGQGDTSDGDKNRVTMKSREDESGESGWPVGAATLKTMGAHRPSKIQWWKIALSKQMWVK